MTLVNIYQSKVCHISEDMNLHHSAENLVSQKKL